MKVPSMEGLLTGLPIARSDTTRDRHKVAAVSLFIIKFLQLPIISLYAAFAYAVKADVRTFSGVFAGRGRIDCSISISTKHAYLVPCAVVAGEDQGSKLRLIVLKLRLAFVLFRTIFRISVFFVRIWPRVGGHFQAVGSVEPVSEPGSRSGFWQLKVR
jgi:hypothetical protein